MNGAPDARVWDSLAALSRAGRERPRAGVERCEVCGVEIDAAHNHVANTASRQLLCACRACYLLFTHDGAGGSRFRAVPERYCALDASRFDTPLWTRLDVPTGLAFLFRSEQTGRVTAFYPSPAGATEAELPLDAWPALTGVMPALETMAADVEALLVRRGVSHPGRDAGAESGATTAFIVPIDTCYELAGVIRRHWRGFQGGADVWRAVDALFERVAERAGLARDRALTSSSSAEMDA